MKKRVIALVLCVTFAMISIIGCSSKKASNPSATGENDKTAENSEGEQKDLSNLTGVGELPVVKEKEELSIFTSPQGAQNSDFVNNEFTKWFEEQTNVHINWQVTSEEDKKEKLTLMMTNGEFPDILFSTYWTNSQLALYGKEKLILPLNDLIDKYAVNLKKLFADYPTLKEDITCSDGNIYGLPYVEEAYHTVTPYKVWVYQPWLDKLNLKIPTTTEEFQAMLIAFRDKDPNGNGIKDEIPLAGTQKGWCADPTDFLINSFLYCGPNQQWLNLEGDKIVPAYTKEEYKKGLKYLNGLYKEGLLSKETFTQDVNQLIAMGTNPDNQILGCVAGGYQGMFTVITDGEDGEWNKWVAIPPLKGPDGVQYAVENPTTFGAATVITKDCKNPEVAIKLMDLMYDNVMGKIAYSGLKGKFWDTCTEGTAISGKTAQWKYLPESGNTDNKNYSWSASGPIGMTRDWHDAQYVEKPECNLEALLYKYSTPYREHMPAQETLVPISKLSYDDETAKELNTLMSPIKEYVTEMRARFITGDADIDGEWDAYLNQLKAMDHERYIKIVQTAYDACKK